MDSERAKVVVGSRVFAQEYVGRYRSSCNQLIEDRGDKGGLDCSEPRRWDSKTERERRWGMR